MIAHINERGEEETVWEHCRKAAKLAGSLGCRQGLKHLAYLTALLHDLGKGTEAFDTYIHTVASGEKWNRPKLNHSSAGGKYIYEMLDTRQYGSKKGGITKAERFTAEIIAWAIFSHHGLCDMLSPDGEDKFHNRLEPETDIYYKEAKQNFEAVCPSRQIEELFQKAAKEVADKICVLLDMAPREKKKEGEMDFRMGLLMRLNASILMESDRSVTAEFMGGIAAKDGAWGPGLWEELEDRLEKALADFPAEGKLSKLRTRISEECKENAGKEDGIYKLCVPTGGGKTLASMRFALEHGRQYNKKRIFYIAPFKAILEQNAQVFRKTFGREDILLEHHSDVLVEENEEEEVQALMSGWNVPIVLTTMVQLLNTLFASGTRCVRRMQALTDAVLIMDEVQSIPVNCIHLFNGAMNFLQKCGTTVVLCSATQPLLERAERPVFCAGDLVSEVPELFTAFRRNEVTDCRTEVKSSRDIAELAGRLILEADSGIVIANTKKAVKLIYQTLLEREADVMLFHLSTDMCPQHRMDRLAGFQAVLEEGKKALCISTPLIEAGVDISAEFMIRTVSKWDSILQAAGRCNRNAETSAGKVYLAECREERIESLKDIYVGKQASLRLLDDFYRNPHLFQGDFLSLAMTEKFYEYYFFERKQEMDYPYEKYDTTLYDLLSQNERGHREEKNKKAKNKEAARKIKIFCQAFCTAGDYFEVISTDAQGVLVPYGKGKELIAKLTGNLSFWEKQKQIGKLQRYLVNVHRHQLEHLKGQGIVEQLAVGGIYCVKDGFYDAQTGITEQGQLTALLL